MENHVLLSALVRKVSGAEHHYAELGSLGISTWDERVKGERILG